MPDLTALLTQIPVPDPAKADLRSRLAFASADATEARAAFLEKRKPVFIGR